jgi:hypothetical protein
MPGEVPSSISKILIAETDVDSSASEQLFTKMAATINGLIDQRDSDLASMNSRLSTFGTFLKKVGGANMVDMTGHMYANELNDVQMVVVSGVWKIKWLSPNVTGAAVGGVYPTNGHIGNEVSTGIAHVNGDVAVCNYDRNNVKLTWAVYRPTNV